MAAYRFFIEAIVFAGVFEREGSEAASAATN
jgi:hypothetical protein